MAILLRTGRKGKDAVAIAREMLTEYGGFRGLMFATQEKLLEIKGVGKAKIAQILASMKAQPGFSSQDCSQPIEQIHHLRIIHIPRKGSVSSFWPA